MGFLNLSIFPTLDKKVFGTRLPNGSPLKPVIAYGMDLIHVIAKSLLDVNPKRFITEYVPPVLVERLRRYRLHS